MFVRYLSFIFVLIISVGRTADLKNMTTREKLAKSLTHMQDMLVVIEAKLEQERKLLSQISDSLNHKKRPAVGRMDYVEPTDIWWQSSNPVGLAEPGATKPGATQSTVQISLSTFLPNLPTTVKGKPVPNKTTSPSPFIKDMKKSMDIDKTKYFPAFLSRFLELVAIKDPAETMPVIHLMTESVLKDLNEGKFDEHPAPIIIGPLTALIPFVQNMTAPALKEQARSAYFALKNKESMLSTGYLDMMDFYGNLFTTADGERLLEALEAFYDFPKGQATAFDVSNKMLTALLEPYMRLKDLPRGVEHYVNELQRRSMNLKQNDRNILLKHPIFLEMMQRLKHAKNSQHHRMLYKQKRLKKHSRDRLLNKRDERRRAYLPSEKDYNHSEYFRDSIENDKLHKIREASSYSDEGDQLVNNLHDALTKYGNVTFKSFRNSDGDINNKQTLRALSTETDDEWILKNNIYKFFEQDKERSL